MSRKRGNDGGSKPGGGNPGPLPQRWLHCPRKAFSIIGDKFLAFKTPLDTRYDSSMSDEFYFHPEMVLASVKTQKKKIGMWIDLTNTSRFYDKEIIERAGCRYVKLNCKGHGETPGPETVNIFIEICSRFIRQNPLDIIGVHCTHGFNRTGFLIVSYLVRELDWSVEAAVAEFSKVRPPGIYKEDYLIELFRLYGDVEDTPPPPVMPQWHTECDDNDHPTNEETEEAPDDAEASTSNGEPHQKKRRKENVQMKATFMEGIPNVKPAMDMEVVKKVQHRIQQLCGLKSSGFPGCQPVSMDRKNTQLLEKPYMVSWKADGTRYMMYIMGQHQIFFIDRDNAVFQIDGLTFVSAHDRSRHLVDTLLDGEMVIDKEVGGRTHPRYLIYDFVSLEGNSIRKEDFNVRYRTIQKEIIDPRIAAMKEGRVHREREPIGVRRKEFWPIGLTEYLLSDRFKAKLSHEPDGLIFQPVEEQYMAGTCPTVLKWKPPSHNSVDFRLKVIIQDRPGMLRERIRELYVGGMDTPFCTMKVTKSLMPFDSKIIECRFDSDRKEWIFMRERTDKSFPNSYKTAVSVCGSIREPVDEQYLTDFISRNSPSAAPIMAPPPPPPSNHRRPHH